jgi:hypothetical protein
MQKAQLYEAILLVNRGIDDAARGLERLKRAKDSGLEASYFDEKLTLFEMHRALLNGYLCSNIQMSEERDDARFGKMHREYEKKFLDEVQVYRDVHVVEERRRLERKPPRVSFLSSEEQRAWERLYLSPPPSVEGHPSPEGEANNRG